MATAPNREGMVFWRLTLDKNFYECVKEAGVRAGAGTLSQARSPPAACQGSISHDS